MNRRDYLKKVGIGVGALAVSPFTISLFQSCQSDLGWNPVFFKNEHIPFLSELSNLIIPSSNEIPGAKELNLLRFVDTYISKVLSKDEKKTFNNSFDGFKFEYLKSSNLSQIDLTTLNGKSNAELFYYIKDNLDFHQLIWEFGSENPQWIHVSYLSKKDNKKQVLITRKKGKYFTFDDCKDCK